MTSFLKEKDGISEPELDREAATVQACQGKSFITLVYILPLFQILTFFIIEKFSKYRKCPALITMVY